MLFDPRLAIVSLSFTACSDERGDKIMSLFEVGDFMKPGDEDLSLSPRSRLAITTAHTAAVDWQLSDRVDFLPRES